jgi:organic radical activating enzyme
MDAIHFRPDVVAGKYDPALFDPTGQNLLINEIFYSIQGEGRHAGRATVFIRFAKCNLACKFCDTEFEKYQVMSPASVGLTAINLLPKGVSPYNVVVDFTGGEPALQNLSPLICLLRDAGFGTLAVETSGSVDADWFGNLDHITCSPKVAKARIVPGVHRSYTDYKWVVNKAFMGIYERDSELLFAGQGSRNYLQPESNLPEWMEACVRIIKEQPGRYRLSLQQHKFLGVR